MQNDRMKEVMKHYTQRMEQSFGDVNQRAECNEAIHSDTHLHDGGDGGGRHHHRPPPSPSSLSYVNLINLVYDGECCLNLFCHIITDSESPAVVG